MMKLELITPNSQYHKDMCDNNCNIQGFMVLSGSSIHLRVRGRDVNVTLPTHARVLCKQCCVELIANTDYQ